MTAVLQRTRLRSVISSMSAIASNYSTAQLRSLTAAKTDTCDTSLRDKCENRDSSGGDWSEWCVLGDRADYECKEYGTLACCCNYFCENNCFRGECTEQGVGGWLYLILIMCGLVGSICICAVPVYCLCVRIGGKLNERRQKEYEDYIRKEEETYHQEHVDSLQEKRESLRAQSLRGSQLGLQPALSSHYSLKPAKSEMHSKSEMQQALSMKRSLSKQARRAEMDKQYAPEMRSASSRHPRNSLPKVIETEPSSLAFSAPRPIEWPPLKPFDPEDAEVARKKNSNALFRQSGTASQTLAGLHTVDTSEGFSSEARSVSSSAGGARPELRSTASSSGIPRSETSSAARLRRLSLLNGNLSDSITTTASSVTSAGTTLTRKQSIASSEMLQKPIVATDTPGKPSGRRTSAELLRGASAVGPSMIGLSFLGDPHAQEILPSSASRTNATRARSSSPDANIHEDGESSSSSGSSPDMSGDEDDAGPSKMPSRMVIPFSSINETDGPFKVVAKLSTDEIVAKASTVTNVESSRRRRTSRSGRRVSLDRSIILGPTPIPSRGVRPNTKTQHDPNIAALGEEASQHDVGGQLNEERSKRSSRSSPTRRSRSLRSSASSREPSASPPPTSKPAPAVAGTLHYAAALGTKRKSRHSKASNPESDRSEGASASADTQPSSLGEHSSLVV